MRQLLTKELREIIWAPLGLLGCVGIITLILNLHHWWDDSLPKVYMIGAGILALYMGAEAISGEREGKLLQWQQLWPVSRLKWWLLKLCTNLTLTILIGGLMYVLLGWLALQNAPEPVKQVYAPSRLWLRGITLVPTFIMAFFCSTFSRTSMQAFGLALAVSAGSSMLFIVPSALYFILAMRNTFPAPPPPYLSLLPTALLAVAPLAGSLHSFLKTPPLEYGKRATQAFKTAGLVLIPGIVVMSGAVLVSTLLVAAKPQGVSKAVVSPDGHRIAFTDSVFNEALWIVNADGTGLRRMERLQPGDFLWLPDSKRLIIHTQMSQPRSAYQRANGMLTNSSQNSEQWSVIDTSVKKPLLQPIPAVKRSGMSLNRLSPTGRYVWLSGQFIDTNTWRVVGNLPVPNYSPWFLTWTPDDSAIYVVEHQQQPFSQTLKRIAIPSGQVSDVHPPANPTQGPVRHTGEIDKPLSGQTDWFYQDRSTYVPFPGGKGPIIYRTEPVRGPNNTWTEVSHPRSVGTQRRLAKTLLYRLGGSQTLLLEGLMPCDNGLSPCGRYCLMNVCDGVTEYDERTPWYAAFVDMNTGKTVSRVTLPGLHWRDDVEGMKWSPDEQWVAIVVRRWSEKTPKIELFLVSVAGEFRQVTVGNIGGFGDDGLAGWTDTHSFVVIQDSKQLVAIGTDGRQRVLVAGENSWEKYGQKHGQGSNAMPNMAIPGRW